jgi:hypothetical protein
MAIEHAAVNSVGKMPGTYHEVTRAEVNFAVKPARVTVYLTTWTDRESKDANGPVVFGWAVDIPNLMVADLEDPEQALITVDGSPFKGGVLVQAGVETLDLARERKWAQIKAEMERRNLLPLEVEGIGTFQADEVSQSRIRGAREYAIARQEAGLEVSIPFILADNSVVLLSYDDARDVGLALGDRLQALYAHRFFLRGVIDDAVSIDAVKAVQWDWAPVVEDEE